MKYRKLFAAALAMLMLAGCAENPDSGIVVHKDMEKVISEAENSSESKVDLAEMQQIATEHYETEINGEKLNVFAKVSADVAIPDVEQLSVLRVKKHEFTDEEIAKYRSVLLGDTQMYDYASARQQTKRDIETQIAGVRESFENELARITDAHDRAVTEEAYRESMERLEQQYNHAPDEAPMILSDGRLKSNAAAAQEDPGNSIHAWRYRVRPDGSTLQEITADAKTMFYACNDPADGNMISYSVTPTAYGSYGFILSANPDRLVVCHGRGVPENFIDHFQYDGSRTYKAVEDDACTLSQEEAEAQAEEWMEKLGITGFMLKEGGRYAELMMYADEENTLYRTNYILRYVRSIGGVPLRQDSGSKFMQEDTGNYTKYYFPPEMIEIRIADAGLLSFTYYAPLDVTETVVDNAQMKPFDEIKSTFERMLPITKAHEDGQGEKIKISHIILGYSRISEKDSWDTGLVVPVWAFLGTKQRLDADGHEIWDSESSHVQPQICINAIDGSVIDPVIGY